MVCVRGVCAWCVFICPLIGTVRKALFRLWGLPSSGADFKAAALVLPDRDGSGRHEEGHTTAGGVCPGDTDVHRAEERQETESSLRAISAYQVCHTSSTYNGCH